MENRHSGSANPAGAHESIWLDTADRTNYDALDGGVRVDTAVVGGGIAGVTTAFELDRTGRSVALLERDRILDGVTGHTTAKVTSLHGLVYDHLLDHFGSERAGQYAAANEWAIEHVAETVDELGVDCDFGRGPAYTYRPPGEDTTPLHDEVEAARELGLPATYVESTDLPFAVAGAVRFDDQAYFHPRKYLLALARRIPGGGSHLFENTTVQEISGGRTCRVDTDRGEVIANSVVVATHFPVKDDALYFSRMSPKRSYVVAAALEGDAPDGMYYDPGEPYFSVRPHAGEDSLVLVGGENHRTGDGESTEARYNRLERRARERFDVDSIEYRWATQDYVSVDRVPFVGPLAPQDDDVYVATGFGGWGMTNGTAAARILADAVRGRDNPWSDVYRPTRFEFGASKSALVSHNTHAMRHYVDDYLGGPPDLDLSDLEPGDGRVFDGRDDPVAVHRDHDGDLHAVSAVCPHLGCLVTWNDGERSWDCPCHGSRFDVDGSVLDTPAVDDLDRAPIARPSSVEHE